MEWEVSFADLDGASERVDIDIVIAEFVDLDMISTRQDCNCRDVTLFNSST